MSSPSDVRVRRRRSDGDRSRAAILDEAARLATVEGLAGLSIARLAEAVGMSKSGLFAHFRSKQELQLATIETAGALFTERVVEPALARSSPLERLYRLADGFLDHVEQGVFPGGCFFASVAAELDTHPGPVRDVAVRFVGDWIALQASLVREAQAAGELDPDADAEQLAFELESALFLANQLFVISADPAVMRRGRAAFRGRLEAAAPRARP
jgi:AcrR family transcriptional regulator